MESNPSDNVLEWCEKERERHKAECERQRLVARIRDKIHLEQIADEESKLRQEKSIVSQLLADPLLADYYLHLDERFERHFYFSQSFWRSTFYHSIFCMVCEMRKEGATWKDVKELEAWGKEFNKKIQTALGSNPRSS